MKLWLSLVAWDTLQSPGGILGSLSVYSWGEFDIYFRVTLRGAPGSPWSYFKGTQEMLKRYFRNLFWRPLGMV